MKHFRKILIPNFIKIRAVTAQVFHAGGRADGRTDGQTDRQTDRQTDMIEPIVAFRSFANVL